MPFPVRTWTAVPPPAPEPMTTTSYTLGVRMTSSTGLFKHMQPPIKRGRGSGGLQPPIPGRC